MIFAFIFVKKTIICVEPESIDVLMMAALNVKRFFNTG